MKKDQSLKADKIDTPLGPMIAIADKKALYLLEFTDRPCLEQETEKLCKVLHLEVVPGKTDPIASIERELHLYFEKRLQVFKTPIQLIGTPFQQAVWKELLKIPMGATCTYSELARKIKKPLAVRAAARANGANQLGIIIPCHRVIGADGSLTGYGGGLERKEKLLNLERGYGEK